MSKETKSKNFKIAYVSDIHLENKIDYMQDIINNISQELKMNNFDILLIGGDTSENLINFESFIYALKKEISNLKVKTKIIFILGNHELFEKAKNLKEIINKYKKVIVKNKMFFIQNSILYLDSNIKNCTFKEITELELSKISTNSLRSKLQEANLIIFGGIGFSYNMQFDAPYGETINDLKLIEESKKFGQLYNKICNSIYDKSTIIFTHIPIEFECYNNINIKNIDNFKYVNGHTHDNNYQKNIHNVYSNNQINKKHIVHLKYFKTEIENINSFLNLKDGIYDINSNDYVLFYRKNIENIDINSERYIGKFYMLKKNNYFCFIYKKTDGKLSLLFRGKSEEKLLSKDVKYYYDNIEQNISNLKLIRENLKEYKEFQSVVSKTIKNLNISGYSGRIDDDGIKIYIERNMFDASIVFINPVNFNIIPYYSKFNQKTFYPNIETLLQKHFHKHYANYIKLKDFIKKYKHKKETEIEKIYFYFDVDTNDNNDIVNKISKKIKRLYALDKNIISTWYETKK